MEYVWRFPRRQSRLDEEQQQEQDEYDEAQRRQDEIDVGGHFFQNPTNILRDVSQISEAIMT